MSDSNNKVVDFTKAGEKHRAEKSHREKEEKVDTSSKNIANYSKAQIEKRIQIKEYLR